jgi:hypothetical protein
MVISIINLILLVIISINYSCQEKDIEKIDDDKINNMCVEAMIEDDEDWYEDDDEDWDWDEDEDEDEDEDDDDDDDDDEDDNNFIIKLKGWSMTTMSKMKEIGVLIRDSSEDLINKLFRRLKKNNNEI